MWFLLVVPVVTSYLVPITYQPMQPLQALPSPFQPVPIGVPATGRGCPLSPYATFLSEDQQQSLHELITEARGMGAAEPEIKSHINKYLGEILTPQRYSEFQEANSQFEQRRIGKRDTSGKQVPVKVFDLLDQYNGGANDNYSKFYEDVSAKKLRQF